MIDLALLREDPERISNQIYKKDPAFDVPSLIALDSSVRSLRLRVESLRQKKNELADSAKGGITSELREQSMAVGKELKEAESALYDAEVDFKALYLRCPNIPNDCLPEGNKEANAVVARHGQPPSFSFSMKNHVELGQLNKWFDFSAAATMTGSNFVLYRGQAVALLHSLILFMLQHNREFGYELIFPPFLVNEKSLENASNFPKFREEVYSVPGDNLYLIPTAEVNLANLYRDTIFSASDLPVRLTAATSCFRREAGGYGAAERGLIRVHQFEKVELFTYCEPDSSAQELEKMRSCAESLLQKLGLHYQVTLLAAQDCSFPSAQTYDLEVWLPSQGIYKEVSSCSNCTDFQARRASVRYRTDPNSKPRLVHTLNGSSLALPRLIAALMETYQTEDGSISMPPVLKGYGLL